MVHTYVTTVTFIFITYAYVLYVEEAENRSEVNKAVQSTSREGEWCNGYYSYI